MDLDQNLRIPLNSKLWCFFVFPLIIFITSFNIDVGIAIIISGEKGVEYSRESCRLCLQ